MQKHTNVKMAVIGWPVDHSKSPIIHEYWIDQQGMSGRYDKISVHPDNLASAVQNVKQAGYCGFNVTVPHKEAILPFMSVLDDDAAKIGAVNTVIVGKDGTMAGYNTDGWGFVENVRRHIPSFLFAGKTAYILGAGGAARAILCELLSLGIGKAYLCNRTKERAEKLADDFADVGQAEFSVLDWGDDIYVPQDVNLFINTTTLGMQGQKPLAVDLTPLSKSALVCDIVYTPLHTDIIQQAQARRMDYVTGIGMLLHQAQKAFSLWFGVMPDVDDGLTQKLLNRQAE